MSHAKSLMVVAALAFASVSWAKTEAPTVEIENGALRGAEDAGVISFKAIPYAAPPVGRLRWRAPLAAGHWSGVRDATKFGPECMQSDDVPKSEDCLTLNVWRPAGAKGPMPVMVWIYGGGLVHGQTSLYPADKLARQGVVVVSVNYRMGRLGFFAHPALLAESPTELHGNYGYLDQRAALQWVQRNIRKFGGDPKAVTIFGESAGGGSVLAHITSPLSRGLFQRAILQSPGIPSPRSKITPLTALADAETRAVEYAGSLGISGNGVSALHALRALPPERLIEGASTQQVIGSITSESSVPGVSGSIIDGKFLVEDPEAAIAAGRWARVPVIVGANSRDLGTGRADSKDNLFAAFGPSADEARKLYDPHGNETLDELKQQVFADKTMLEPARHLADLVARSGQPVWLYRFSYVAEALRNDPKWKGTLHGFEIPYTFDIPGAVVKDKVTAADRSMGQTASAYWIAFAKTGDPNGAGRPTWPRHQPGVDTIINFTNEGVAVGPDPLRARLDLWAKVSNPQGSAFASARPGGRGAPMPVNVHNFVRAETDLYFAKAALNDGAFGKLRHRRAMADIDNQDVVRMNRDTLYSSGVFDLAAAPLTITLPDAGKRFQSMQVISQDHYTTEVAYGPGAFTYTQDKVGTRYVYVIIRTLANAQSPEDVKAANAVQDAIKVEQARAGTFELQTWDKVSQEKARDALSALGSLGGTVDRFGSKDEVDVLDHLIGTAIGWGGNPRSAADYQSFYPAKNDGRTIHTLTFRDVPVDGFWSISVYDDKGYFRKNDLNKYSLNNLTAKANADGGYTVQFGGCQASTPNCLPIVKGWNYTIRLYRPRRQVLDGSWKFPEAQAVN